MSTPVNVRHYCNIGDIISSLIGLKRFYEITGRKINFCQQINVRGRYYDNAVHPVTHNGEMVMTNAAIWEMIKPLLLAQEYIESCEEYVGQPMGQDKDGKLLGIDLTVIRQHIFVNMPNQAIQQWLFIAFPDIAADISKAWMTIPDNVDISKCYIKYNGVVSEVPDMGNKVMVNFTERYRNEHLDYFFLKDYDDQLIF
jgi:hypothetical protein